MGMTLDGLAKLAEELGELQQVVGKRLAYYTTEQHPDGGPPLSERLEEEIADVMAACDLVVGLHRLDSWRVEERRRRKLAQFHEWHAAASNDVHGVMPPRGRLPTEDPRSRAEEDA